MLKVRLCAMVLLSSAQRFDIGLLANAEPRSVRANLVAEIARAQMPVVSFNHARVDVTEIPRDDHKRHSRHDAKARP